jgi:hypothetical protein
VSKPTKEEIFTGKVNQLKESIWQTFRGRTASQIDIRTAMLNNWFGRVKNSHFTQTFKELEEDKRIIKRSGAVAKPYTKFTFKSNTFQISD